MASGGRRNRSGPPADPSSGRSDLRGFRLDALPAEGYRGEVPDFPLPEATDRELMVWEQAWHTPQACAWSMPSEVWRQRTVALWVRISVRCEDPGVSASTLGQLHRFADQVGMTTAGLAEMGWSIKKTPAAPEVPTAGPSGDAPQRRLRAV